MFYHNLYNKLKGVDITLQLLCIKDPNDTFNSLGKVTEGTLFMSRLSFM